MSMLCERCKREVYRWEQCNYCSKKICNACMKASQKTSKTIRFVICKDCWSNMKTRSTYKHKQTVMEQRA